MSEVIVNLQWVIDHNKAAGQPLWKYVANYGDVTYLDYGGVFLFKDLTGRYGYEIEILQEPAPCSGDEYKAYRICMERCYYSGGVLSDNRFHRKSKAWFADIMDGMTQEERYRFVASITSRNGRERIDAYLEIIGYHGAYEFDQYPNTYTRKEAEERYKKLGVK